MSDLKNDCNKDWRKIARASGLSIPDSALERIAQSLDALEAAFRPLARALPPETEPAVAFHASRDLPSRDLPSRDLPSRDLPSHDRQGVVKDSE